MQRRKFLSCVGGGLFAGSLVGYPSASAAESVAGSFSFLSEPYLQNPTDTSMTVRWITNQPSDSWVEYGTTPLLDKKAFATIDGLKTAGRIQAVTLAGLSPETKYFYRVVSRQITDHQGYSVDFGQTLTSKIFSLQTFATAPKRVRFTVFNDLHQKVDLWKRLAGQVSKFAPDFTVLNGDIMNSIDSEELLIDNIIAPAAEILGGSVPYYFVRGNHETRGVFSRELINYLSLPDDRYYYARTIGPIRLVVLDSGEDKGDSHRAYSGLADFGRYRSIQQEWLRGEIASIEFKNAAFRVVIHHIPPLPNPNWHGEHDCFLKWAPLHAKGKIDLFIGGHTHRHTIMQPSVKANRPYIMAIGGGPEPGNGTVMKVQADEKELSVTMVSEKGKVVGKQRIARKE